jgi:adenylate cyclase
VGDGFLIEFASAVQAVNCAKAIQEANSHLPLRIGIHVGDVVVQGDDLMGDGVNVAARVEGIAEPGGIAISRQVYDQVRDKLELGFVDKGEIELKNIQRPVQVFVIGGAKVKGPATLLPLPDKPSIAVLPFQNMSGDPEQQYFADGICEDLITALSKVSWLFVIARNSSFAFRDERLDIRTIGAKLGVRYLVEGSVRKAGGRVRLTAQLIDGASGNHLWADKFDGALEQVFDLQDQITASIIGAVEPKLRTTEIARASRKRIDSLDAFDLVLQALPKQAAMTNEGLATAIDLLDQAIALSPSYSEALAYGAWCRALRPLHGFSPDPARDFREASDLAKRALSSDPDDALALRCAGITVVLVDRDYQSGWDLMERSLRINPNAALTWGLCGWISMWAGEPERGITEFEKAIRLSPFDQWISNYSNGMAFSLNTSGQFEEGLRWARKCMQENPLWVASHRQLIAALSLNGRLAEARESADRYRTLDPNFRVFTWAKNTPFRRTSSQERLFAALVEAGLPE